jgi:hypothetical protein
MAEKMDTKGSTTVTVGCKLPHGLTIALDEPQTKMVEGKETTVYVPNGRTIELRGANSSAVVGGYGITENVDGEAFRKWLAEHRDFPAVVNGLVFVVERSADAPQEAQQRRDVKTGVEGLNPEAPAPGIKRNDDK